MNSDEGVQKPVEGSEKIDKLQQELDELEKRAQDELSKQKPSFSVVEEENEKKEPEPSVPEVESSPITPEAPDEPEAVENAMEGGKVISSQIVEDDKQKEQSADLPPLADQPIEPIQIQPNEEGEKQKDPVDANKMTKSIFWIALVLFLITLTAVGAYFVGSRNVASTTKPTPTPLAVKTPMPTPTPAASITSFVNETYGYSYNYPATMSMVKDLSAPDEIVTITQAENSFVVYAGTQSFKPASGVTPETESDYVISGITTTKEVYTSLYEVYVFPENESQVNQVVVRYNNGVSTPEYESIMMQVLASFKVTQGQEPTPSASPEATPSAPSSPTPAGGP